MADQLLRELEAAAQVLLAPPNLVTAEQRQSAEAVFLNFRLTKSPYQLCREILETTTTDYVLFETAGVIKAALIREWSLLQQSDITSLRQYLLHFVISKPTLAPFVREKILQVIAIMIKRGSIQDLGEERNEILDQVETLVTSGDMPRQLLGCSIMSAIMQEYATTEKSSDIGLTWEMHFKAKRQFEVTSLKRIFKFCVQVLGELTKAEVSETILPLIKHLLSICESRLTWIHVYANRFKRYFVQHHFLSVSESESHPSLQLTPLWSDIILDPAVIDLFFTVYWKIRSNPQLAHHARTCIVQLASVNGKIVSNDEVKMQYLTTYVQSFMNLLTNIEVIDQEAIGFASIYRKLTLFHRSRISNMPEELLKTFMEQMTRLTCLFAEGASQEEGMCADDCMYMEAFESFLETWCSIISFGSVFPEDFIQRCCIQIFNTYMHCRLSPPDGIRGTSKEQVEEIDANEEKDCIKFKNQLTTIGELGRQILRYSLPLLSRILEDRTNKLKEQLNWLVGQPTSMNTSNLSLIENLYEDLYWLVLISGYLLCMESKSEISLVPSKIMQYSMEQAKQGTMDINVTLQLLGSPQSNITDINGAEQSADHVIRLIAAVFRLSEVAKITMNFNATQHLSPELCSTIIRFLQLWSVSYLTPEEKDYSELSTTLVQAFGDDSPGCTWTVNFILEKVLCNINAFKGEPALIQEAIKLLIILVESPKASIVLKSEHFGNLVELATKSQDLPQAAKRGLMKAIVKVGSCITENDRQQYYNQIIQPLQSHFKEIVCHADFPNNYHQEEIRNQIIDILESLIGVSQGYLSDTVSLIWHYICPVLSDLPRLLALYHNYQQIVQLILELFYECSDDMICFLKDVRNFFQISLQMMEEYAKCNKNRLTTDATAEEDTSQELLILMQLLTNFLSSFLHLDSNEPPGNENNQDHAVSYINIFLYGLNIVMPMMTIDLLKFPSLCLQYFKMLTFLCEMYPEKVGTLPPPLLQQLLISIELGLFSFGDEVTLHCCDIIQAMATHTYNQIKKGEPKTHLMAPFLNVLMNLIINHQINVDLISHTTAPIYSLICCYQEQYQQLVQRLIADQSDPVTIQRLTDAFQKLCDQIFFDGVRADALQFGQNFEKFIINVQGFLIVK